jgi:small subunit ribosomal protein S16
LGTYNPNTNPATIDLNFEQALKWVLSGAQPTDTARNILSDKGVYLKKHLLGGVAKGAFSEAVADQKFNEWLNAKNSKLEAVKNKLVADKAANAKTRLDAEQAVNKAKAEAVAKKKAEALAAKQEAEAAAKAEAAAENSEDAQG